MYDSNNGYNHNCRNEILFFNIFKNKILRNKIFSFIHRDKSDHFYDATSSLTLMVDNNKYEMIYDKLKNNNFIYIDNQLPESIIKLFNGLSKINQIERIFTPLLNKYKNIIDSFTTPIFDAAIKDNNLKIIKYLINYYSLNNSDQSHLLTSLLIESSYDSFKIFKYLFSLIKSNKNNNNDIDSDNNNNDTDMNDNNSILKSIKKFDQYNFDYLVLPLLNKLSKEKVEFIENELKINLKQFINENQETIKYLKTLEPIAIHQEIIESLLIINEESLVPIIKFNNPTFLKIQIFAYLNRQNKNFQKKYMEKFKEFFINNPNIKTTKEIIFGIKSIISNIKGEDQVNIGLFELIPFEICYYFMEESKYEEITNIIKNPHYSSNYYQISPRVIQSIVLFYSMSHYSIEALQFFLEMDSKIHYTHSSSVYEDNTTEINPTKAHIFIKSIFNNDKIREKVLQIIPDEMIRLLDIIITNYDTTFFESLLNENTHFKNFYYQTIEFNFKKVVEIYSTKDKVTNQYNKEKIDFLIKQIKIGKLETAFCFLDTSSNKSLIVPFFSYLMKNIEQDLMVHYVFSNKLFLDFQNLKLNEIVEIFNSIDQEQYFRNLMECFQSDGNFAKKNSYIFNKSNLFLKKLSKSISKRRYNKINQIISTTNNNKNIQIPTTLYKPIEIIKYLFENNYLESFDIKSLVELLTSHIPDINSFEIIEMAQKSTINENSKKHLCGYNSILLKYNLDDILLDENNEDTTSFSLGKLFEGCYYQKALELSLNKPKSELSLGRINYQLLFDKSMSLSIEWFNRLYTPIYETIFSQIHFSQNFLVLKLSSASMDIFEILWTRYLKLDCDKIGFISTILHHNKNHQQLTMYILKEKKQFLIDHYKFNYNFFKDICLQYLIDGDLELFKLFIQISPPSFQFTIDSNIFKLFFLPKNPFYHTIEYLIDNNYILDLENIISTIDFNSGDNEHKPFYNIPKIIFLQKIIKKWLIYEYF
ncbi:hypothetical protein DICPUDRAFT_75315 [Dictyostelium purpureum]|uniref:Uncharacterized protein n=1 Tax=Dictyostelium purpureum TaxID=5786 RepID=F0ZAB2_DICPU|nr:uncharacterized protein DICPUDRAFT_75315 [Dictyostelium purpureum]EGC39120.1 hypothetical protein DICPUDRAFT_75315 [Dictyostelium purpureum]|eukprot:XP_003284372.1 hypothetical protein DICPUDRAFT_75315 [Dictyostelium purpureum]